MILARRSFILGAAASLLAAPSIVRAGSLMPVKTLPILPAVSFSPHGSIFGIWVIGWDAYGTRVEERISFNRPYITRRRITIARYEARVIENVAQNLARNTPDVVVI